MEAREQNKKIWDHYQDAAVDSFDGNGPRLRALIGQLNNKLPSTISVLNIGVGNGYLEKMLHAKNYKVSALDLSENSIKKLVQAGIDGHLGSITESPFQEEQFDYVIASEVLEHLSNEDLPLALHEIARILKKNGEFIGTVPFNEDLKENTVVCPSCDIHFHKWGHQQTFNKESLSALLASQLKITKLKVQTFVEWRGRGVFGFIRSVIRYALGLMGSQISSPHIFFKSKKTNS